jgi:hypothetical protein
LICTSAPGHLIRDINIDRMTMSAIMTKTTCWMRRLRISLRDFVDFLFDIATSSNYSIVSPLALFQMGFNSLRQGQIDPRDFTQFFGAGIFDVSYRAKALDQRLAPRWADTGDGVQA